MLTYTPLENEFNVMTQDDLDRLRETYSSPAEIQARQTLQELPILIDTEDRRTRRVFKKIGLSFGSEDDAEGKSTDGATALGDEGSSSLSSSSSSGAMSESWLPFELRSDGMSKRISLKKVAQKVEESKGVGLAKKSTPTTKGVVIDEKRSRDEASNISLSEAKSKGKEALLPPVAKKAKSATSSAPATKGVKQALAPEEGTLENPRNTLGPRASMLGSASGWSNRQPKRGDKKAADELKEKNEAMARLEEEVAKLKKNKVLAKKKAMEEYKSSEDSKRLWNLWPLNTLVRASISNRKLAHHHPNLSIDLDNMGLDHDLPEEEEAEDKGEGDKEKKGNEEKGRRRMVAVPSLLEYLYFYKLFSSLHCNGDM
ncbi:hypothetical protein Acr_05g0007140 [Actinidia rufa]|uniref:Uncharacterized protein n=1 Tax=Actinidia rufa TaxID=165716 RepID=A0A7J0EKT5_9ERIC|nr:hypothetical protein Acr_05g0007140 [Actinidia rufa]